MSVHCPQNQVLISQPGFIRVSWFLSLLVSIASPLSFSLPPNLAVATMSFFFVCSIIFWPLHVLYSPPLEHSGFSVSPETGYQLHSVSDFRAGTLISGKASQYHSCPRLRKVPPPQCSHNTPYLLLNLNFLFVRPCSLLDVSSLMTNTMFYLLLYF